MDDAQSQFLNSATSCFDEDLEKKHAGQALLASQLSNEKLKVECANRQLKAADQRPPWLMRGVCAALIVLGFWLVMIPAYKIYQSSGIIRQNNLFGIPMPSSDYDPWSFYFDDLSSEDELLLFGDRTQLDEASQKEAFWRAEPDNPGAYIEYLSAYRMNNGQFPKDMLDVAGDIDSENAIYLLFQIGELTKHCTEKVYPSSVPSSRRAGRGRRRSKSLPPVSPAPPVTRKHVAITDVEKHRETLELLHRAGVMNKCTSYGRQMMQRRLPLLERDDHDWISRMLPVMYLASQFTHSMSLIRVSQAIEAEAYRCGKENDPEALRRLIDDWENYCGHLHEMSESLVDALVLRASIQAPCKEFAEAAKACGLVEEEQFFNALDKRLTDDKKARDVASKSSNFSDVLYKHGSMLSYMSLPVLNKQVNDASSIPLPDTRPDRLADHAFWNRVSSAVQWKLLLIFALITWLWQFRSNRLIRRLGNRLADVFSWKDWVFVVTCGSVLPVVIYWLINGTHTNMSVQNWNLTYSAMMMPAGQSGSLLLLLILAPMLCVSYRLNKSLPFTGKLGHRMLWISASLSLFAMPMFGLAGSVDSLAGELIKAGFAAQGLAILILLACPFVAMIYKHREGGAVLVKAASRPVLAVVYLVSSLVMALQVPLFHSKEKHWVAQDEIFQLGSDYTSFTLFETEVTRQLLKEMNVLIQQMNTER